MYEDITNSEAREDRVVNRYRHSRLFVHALVNQSMTQILTQVEKICWSFGKSEGSHRQWLWHLRVKIWAYRLLALLASIMSCTIALGEVRTTNKLGAQTTTTI